MAWNAAKPAGADKIKDSDDNIRLNNDAIETVLGTNITAGPTTIQGAIQGDATKGRHFRGTFILIENGTDGVSLKCTVTSRWNGDTIAITDNIAKNATTGDFTLDATGIELKIEASGLTGNCLYCIGNLFANFTTTDLTVQVQPTVNDILIRLTNISAGNNLDITTLVDTGSIYVDILYITDA